jgi:hypothetical protein
VHCVHRFGNCHRYWLALGRNMAAAPPAMRRHVLRCGHFGDICGHILSQHPLWTTVREQQAHRAALLGLGTAVNILLTCFYLCLGEDLTPFHNRFAMLGCDALFYLGKFGIALPLVMHWERPPRLTSVWPVLWGALTRTTKIIGAHLRSVSANLLRYCPSPEVAKRQWCSSVRG